MVKHLVWRTAAVLFFCLDRASPLCLSTSSFHGISLERSVHHATLSDKRKSRSVLEMRKQKSSNKRTSRLQKGGVRNSLPSANTSASFNEIPSVPSLGLLLKTPMSTAGWERKSIDEKFVSFMARKKASNRGGGRGRARKRTEVYALASSYKNEFVNMLTAEYRAEEKVVLNRLEASMDFPPALEYAGEALFDMYPERRGNVFTDEVYRLTKASDATIRGSLHRFKDKDDKSESCISEFSSNPLEELPSNHKFSANDVILLTLQPRGSGDFFGVSSAPTHPDSTSVEARVLSTGPHYVDIALPGGSFETIFGPAPNNLGPSGMGDPGIRLRVDRFFSNIPYMRMISALERITDLPENRTETSGKKKRIEQTRCWDHHSLLASEQKKEPQQLRPRRHSEVNNFDPLLREAILATYGCDSSNSLYRDSASYDVNELARRLAKKPFPKSTYLANEVLGFLQSNPGGRFDEFNASQLAAIGASLSRRLTLIHGPPGTGKTTVAGAIAFGFVHQCRNLSPEAKVLSCAFSNVGADNLGEQMLKLGLKIVRVGKAPSVSKHLWDHTLDAAISRDPVAKQALEDAAKATSTLHKKKNRRSDQGQRKGDSAMLRSYRDFATSAVKVSIQACRVAATKALRQADVIICTSVGAADTRLLAACGILSGECNDFQDDSRLHSSSHNTKQRRAEHGFDTSSKRQEIAPDGLPALSLPFVVIDEACQSIEPADLIPITATNSCRSLVLLGDPCQLPPTVLSDPSGTGSSSPLSVSLMGRLASTLPHPVIVNGCSDATEHDVYYLNSKPTRQAVSLVEYRKKKRGKRVSYRSKFSGSMLLSVQYRMHPSISAFPSAVFYDRLLATPTFMSNLRPFPQGLSSVLPVENAGSGIRFVDVGGRSNEQREAARHTGIPQARVSFSTEASNSFCNAAEAGKILRIIKCLFRKYKTGIETLGTIGIVTPYAAQVALIKEELGKDSELRQLSKYMQTIVEVKSVDSYQGRERDLIIFSAVRSNKTGTLGFLRDWRRMNVAITRARTGLIVVGDLETLKSGDEHWEAFCNWCVASGCITSTKE